MGSVLRVASSLRAIAVAAVVFSAGCIYLTGVSDYEKGACEAPCGDAATDSASESSTDSGTDCPPDMVSVAGGAYNPGGGIVRIGSLCVDRTEVTESAYRACVSSGGCTAAGNAALCNFAIPGRENDPINCVNLAQAKTFCEKLGKRLPTEDEWEWVARGGNLALSFPWSNIAPTAADDPERLCWQGRTMRNDPAKWPTRPAGTCAVQSFPAGARDGIFDLAGNVWEWTSTSFDATKFVFRGGSAFDDPVADTYKVSARGSGASTSFAGVGFRCFRDAN